MESSDAGSGRGADRWGRYGNRTPWEGDLPLDDREVFGSGNLGLGIVVETGDHVGCGIEGEDASMAADDAARRIAGCRVDSIEDEVGMPGDHPEGLGLSDGEVWPCSHGA